MPMSDSVTPDPGSVKGGIRQSDGLGSPVTGQEPEKKCGRSRRGKPENVHIYTAKKLASKTGETCSLFCFLSQFIVGINFDWDAEKIEIFRPSLTGKNVPVPIDLPPKNCAAFSANKMLTNSRVKWTKISCSDQPKIENESSPEVFTNPHGDKTDKTSEEIQLAIIADLLADLTPSSREHRSAAGRYRFCEADGRMDLACSATEKNRA